MSTSSRSSRRVLWTAVRAMLLLSLLLGVAYPALMTGVAQLAFPAQANGSLVHDASGAVRGSALLGQSFADASGAPLPQYFQPRPSAAGEAPGYDATASGGSNLGPENPELAAAIEERRASIAAFDGVDPSLVPPDAVTASGSGLDPDISPAYAAIQIARVAAARGLDPATVEALVAAHSSPPALGFLGEPTVNVLTLNLALDGFGTTGR